MAISIPGAGSKNAGIHGDANLVYAVTMEKHRFTATDEDSGKRLDKLLSERFLEYSRNYFQNLLEKKQVLINGKPAKSNSKLKQGDKVDVRFPPLKELEIEAKDIPLNILYEDDNLLVIDKPAGLVVHPGTHGSHSEDSLVNAILHHCKGRLGGIGGTLRPGIVHRLDKDTSGLLVVAKNDKAQRVLMEQFQSKQVVKIYYALLAGRLEPQKGVIDAPIGRSLQDRKKMAVVEGKSSKEALTKYEVVRYLGDYTYVKVYLLTGRTHQIRVHFAAIGFPLVGDQTYGRAKVNHRFEQHYGLQRQFLHAAHLSFSMPSGGRSAVTTKKGEFESPLPSDLQRVLDDLDREIRR